MFVRTKHCHGRLTGCASAAETIVLGSSEKLNAESTYVIAPISEIAGMIVAATTKRKKLTPFVRLELTP
jgi:DeoR/GlpR family transcriptional regulator of sugar metabolism